MSKKLIIGLSIGLVVLGTAVFGVVLLRSRVLSDTRAPTVSPPQTPSSGGITAPDTSGSASLTETPEVLAPALICGDGICSEGERNCSIDCGMGEDYFRSSVIIRPDTETSVTAMWKTKTASTGSLVYGKTPAASDGSEESTTPGTNHEVTLSGLDSGSNYYFGINVTESDGTTYQYGPYIYEGIGPPIQ